MCMWHDTQEEGQPSPGGAWTSNHVYHREHNTAAVARPVSPKSPRREVVRSSAGAGAVYPPFLGSFA